MKTPIRRLIQAGFLLGVSLLLTDRTAAQDKINSSTQTEKKMKQVLIDKLIVPANVKDEYLQQMSVIRNIVNQFPGFEKDYVYEQTDESGNSVFITVAVWKEGDYLKKARQSVEVEYKRIGFSPREFCQKRNITMDRIMDHGIYWTSGN